VSIIDRGINGPVTIENMFSECRTKLVRLVTQSVNGPHRMSDEHEHQGHWVDAFSVEFKRLIGIVAMNVTSFRGT